MYSEWRFKTSICSVILTGELESFRNYKEHYFPENFRCNLTYHESENFLDSPLSITFLNPKILVSLFCTKKTLT